MIYCFIDLLGEKVFVLCWDVFFFLGFLMVGREMGKKCFILLVVLLGCFDKVSGLVVKSRLCSGLLCELSRSGWSG